MLPHQLKDKVASDTLVALLGLDDIRGGNEHREWSLTMIIVVLYMSVLIIEALPQLPTTSSHSSLCSGFGS